MLIYSNSFSISTPDKIVDINKLITRFEDEGFTQKSSESSVIVLERKGSVLDGWKLDPATWESTIKIIAKEHYEYDLTYRFHGIYVTPIAFADYYNAYFEDILSSNDIKKSIEKRFQVKRKKAKGKVLYYYILILIGLTAFGGLGVALAAYFDIKYFGYLGILVGATTSIRCLNKFLIAKSGVIQS